MTHVPVDLLLLLSSPRTPGPSQDVVGYYIFYHPVWFVHASSWGTLPDLLLLKSASGFWNLEIYRGELKKNKIEIIAKYSSWVPLKFYWNMSHMPQGVAICASALCFSGIIIFASVFYLSTNFKQLVKLWADLNTRTSMSHLKKKKFSFCESLIFDSKCRASSVPTEI